MTTVVSVAQGGTGANNATQARLNLGITPASTLNVSANGGTTKLTETLNFINTASVTINVSNAASTTNVSFDVIAGLGFVRDSFVGNGSEVNFTLSGAPVNEDNALVFVDRILQRNSEYNVSATTLTFTGAPESNSVIDVFVTQFLSNVSLLRSGDTMTGNLNVDATLITQNILPNSDLTYDIGSSGKRFKDLYLSNSTIYLGDVQISANDGKLVVPAVETSSGVNLESQIANAYAQANLAYTAANTGGGGGPKVITITYPDSANAASNSGNESVILTGSGFESGVQIYINGNAVPALSRTNSNSISFTTPALGTGATYPVYVVNPDGGTAIFVPGMQVSAGPVWVTTSPLPSWTLTGSLSTTLEASSDSSVTYSLEVGSSLPSGITLAANGLLSGTLTSPPASETTYNFTVVATDAESQKSSKAFSITALAAVTFGISPAVNGKSTWNTAIDGPLVIDSWGTYTITPDSNMNANVVMWGAGGGGASAALSSTRFRGGGGGASNGFVTMYSNTSYIIRIGQGGRGANTTNAITFRANANAGGAGTWDGNWGAGSGGAYTGIFAGSETQANAVMIAGGGGGGGVNRNQTDDCTGGAGGGSAAANGSHSGSDTSTYAGKGGTQSAGGAGGSGTSYGTAETGSALTGGTTKNGSNVGIGAGGGSGYFGGGSGTYSGDIVGGGGGGSGYANNAVTSGVTLTVGNKFNPALNTHAYYANSAGLGGNGSTTISATVGGNGRFVLVGVTPA